MINPKGVWHTSDVHEVGSALFVTPGAAPSTGRAMNALGDGRPVAETGRSGRGLARPGPLVVAGGTLWCAAPACEARAEEMAADSAARRRPSPGTRRPGGDLFENLRSRARPGDMLLLARARLTRSSRGCENGRRRGGSG